MEVVEVVEVVEGVLEEGEGTRECGNCVDIGGWGGVCC